MVLVLANPTYFYIIHSYFYPHINCRPTQLTMMMCCHECLSAGPGHTHTHTHTQGLATSVATRMAAAKEKEDMTQSLQQKVGVNGTKENVVQLLKHKE